jgi:simple sugar transport system permease protein
LFAGFAAAVVVGSLIILAAGKNPLSVYFEIISGAFGSTYFLTRTLMASVPLIFTGLAFAFAMRGGLFNIGIEGQVLTGAFVAAWVGSLPLGSGWVSIPLAVILAAASAGAVGLLMAALRIRFGASEVITGIMFYNILMLLFAWLMRVWVSAPGAYATPRIMEFSQLPATESGLHLGLLFALMAVAAVFGYERKTGAAFIVRAVGTDMNVCRYQGIKVGRVMLFALGVSGAIAGLAGAFRVLGESHRFLPDIAGGAGWLGIAVALVARNNPLAVVPAALLIGALKVGGFRVEQELGLSGDITLVITMLFVLAVSARRLLAWMPGNVFKTFGKRGRVKA